MSARLVVLGLASAVCAFGYSYAYDYSGAVTSSSMTQNGTVAAWTPAAQFYAGGSLIWNPAIHGAVPTDYEVNSTVALAPGGGTYVQYFRATPNAQSTPGGCTGTFASVELVVPSSYSFGGAMAHMNVYECSAGSKSLVTTVFAPVLNGSTFRNVVFGGNLWIYIDNQLLMWMTISTTGGQPGIGGYGQAAGAGFTRSLTA